MKTTVVVFLIFCFAACTSDNNNLSVESSKVIKDVYDTEVSLPPPENLFTQGAEAFKANCITCHSLRYIQMQPDFPEETWQKIVDKMIKSFGAPIPDSTSKAIVKYLVAIKGDKESQAKQ